MNINLTNLDVKTRQTVESFHFSESVTFLYGPVGTGKSTVARLIDYCFGGDLEQTPAIQQEFVSVSLGANLGEYACTFERGAEDGQFVRVTWSRGEGEFGSVNAPLTAGEVPILDKDVFNLSDLIFHLCDVDPIKVPKRSRDPESPLIRLSFRDIWWYCYLEQTHLDSSFFHLEDTFKGRKSQDAMRFFTGLHSEQLNQLQADLYKIMSEQQGARETVAQIRRFMVQFDLGSELELMARIESAERELRTGEERKRSIESDRTNSIHPTDDLRISLRDLSQKVFDLREAIRESQSTLAEQESLRAELITAKVKSGRAEHAGRILDGVEYIRCPQCGTDISARPTINDQCHLCGSPSTAIDGHPGMDGEVVRRELNDRIDQLHDSIIRRRQALERTERELHKTESVKRKLDAQLEDELRRYDSAFIESIRVVDREIAKLEERLLSLKQLHNMIQAIGELEQKAGESQGRIDRLRSMIEEERNRLRFADDNARAIALKFKSIMLEVGFPGVSDEDRVVLDPRNWKPVVVHSDQEWGFWDTGSGGKKTLFNVCYALALHEVARELNMPIPNILIFDSPTKNISDEENPEIVQSLYREIYRFAADRNGTGTQFILIDSDLVEPEIELTGFSQRRMAGEQDAPSLISYYVGP